MFHFPAFPPTSLYIQLAVTHHEDEPGFPIRKSSDQSSVISSPRLIADSHVLHRLLMPRHPPCALNNLHTIKKNKNPKLNNNTKTDAAQIPEDARVHYIVLKQQTHTTPQNQTNIQPHSTARQNRNHKHKACSPKTQQHTLPNPKLTFHP